jgi:hypothetical protein
MMFLLPIFFAGLLSVGVAQTADNVPLGLAGDYVILSKSGISNVPTSDITGDIG